LRWTDISKPNSLSSTTLLFAAETTRAVENFAS
jgi:hypothetical protein